MALLALRSSLTARNKRDITSRVKAVAMEGRPTLWHALAPAPRVVPCRAGRGPRRFRPAAPPPPDRADRAALRAAAAGPRGPGAGRSLGPDRPDQDRRARRRRHDA